MYSVKKQESYKIIFVNIIMCVFWKSVFWAKLHVPMGSVLFPFFYSKTHKKKAVAWTIALIMKTSKPIFELDIIPI